jgi:hypothetical protein
MLEVTIVGFHGDTRDLKTFQFENDALQAYLTECSANEHGCQITSLRALGVPLTVTGDVPKQAAKARATAAEAAESDNPRAKVNQPITRTAGPGSVRTETPAKPSTERK